MAPNSLSRLTWPDEIVEVDAATRQVTRRVKVDGAPFGLAIDAKGERLYTTCRDDDKVVALDTRTLQPTASVEVGAAPVAIAYCQTKGGDRLIVANSISDNISLLTTEPLKELDRPQAGREPYSVAVTPDSSVAFIANRLAVPDSYFSVPDSELTMLDPETGRLLLRSPLRSAHLAEGVATVPGRKWGLIPFVKVHNLAPITQVANGWVMCSGLAISDYEGRSRSNAPG